MECFGALLPATVGSVPKSSDGLIFVETCFRRAFLDKNACFRRAHRRAKLLNFFRYAGQGGLHKCMEINGSL